MNRIGIKYGYININQDGNYTKHYYADAAPLWRKFFFNVPCLERGIKYIVRMSVSSFIKKILCNGKNGKEWRTAHLRLLPKLAPEGDKKFEHFIRSIYDRLYHETKYKRTIRKL